jgi:Domain of unknown function (DUF6468)
MSYGIPFVIEGIVAVLLLFTILYCIRLNRGIIQLKGNEKTLKSTIAELITATETAERAISGLKITVQGADQTLGERLRSAEKFSTDIARQIESAEAVLTRVTQIAALKPGVGAQTLQQVLPDTKAIMAKAQAFAERTRSRAPDIAA